VEVDKDGTPYLFSRHHVDVIYSDQELQPAEKGRYHDQLLNRHHMSQASLKAYAISEVRSPRMLGGGPAEIQHPGILHNLAQTKSMEGSEFELLQVPLSVGQVGCFCMLSLVNGSTEQQLINHEWSIRAQTHFNRGDLSLIDIRYLQLLMAYHNRKMTDILPRVDQVVHYLQLKCTNGINSLISEFQSLCTQAGLTFSHVTPPQTPSQDPTGGASWQCPGAYSTPRRGGSQRMEMESPQGNYIQYGPGNRYRIKVDILIQFVQQLHGFMVNIGYLPETTHPISGRKFVNILAVTEEQMFTPLEETVCFINQVYPVTNFIRTPPFQPYLVDSGADVHIASMAHVIPGSVTETSQVLNGFGGGSKRITQKGTILVYATDYHSSRQYAFHIDNVCIHDSEQIILSERQLSRSGVIYNAEYGGIEWWVQDGEVTQSCFSFTTRTHGADRATFSSEFIKPHPQDHFRGVPPQRLPEPQWAGHKITIQPIAGREYQEVPVKDWTTRERKDIKHPVIQEGMAQSINLAYSTLALHKCHDRIKHLKAHQGPSTEADALLYLRDSLDQDEWTPGHRLAHELHPAVALEGFFGSDIQREGMHTYPNSQWTKNILRQITMMIPKFQQYRWKGGEVQFLTVVPSLRILERYTIHNDDASHISETRTANEPTWVNNVTEQHALPWNDQGPCDMQSDSDDYHGEVNAVTMHPYTPGVCGQHPHQDHWILNHVGAQQIRRTVTECAITAFDCLTKRQQDQYLTALKEFWALLRSNGCISCTLQKNKHPNVIRAHQKNHKLDVTRTDVKNGLLKQVHINNIATQTFAARLPLIKKLSQADRGCYHLPQQVNLTTRSGLDTDSHSQSQNSTESNTEDYIEVHNYKHFTILPSTKTIDLENNILRYDVQALYPYEHFFIDLKDLAFTTHEGNQFALVLVCYKTLMTHVELMKKKSDIKDKLFQLVSLIGIHKLPYQCCMHYDGDPTNYPAVDAVCHLGIAGSPTIPYRANSNRAELAIQHVVRAAKKLLIHSQLSPKYLGFAMKYAAHVNQYISQESRGGLSPYQMIYGHKPDITHLKVFGSLAAVQKSDVKRKDGILNTIEPSERLTKNEICIFIGFGLVRRNRTVPADKVYTFLTAKGEMIRSKDVYWLRHSPRDPRQLNPKIFNHMQLDDLNKQLEPDTVSVMKELTEAMFKDPPGSMTDDQLLQTYKQTFPEKTTAEDMLRDIMLREKKNRKQMEKEIASSQRENASTQVHMLQSECQQNHIFEPVASAEEGKYNDDINKISLTTTVEKEQKSSEALQQFQSVVMDIAKSPDSVQKLHTYSLALANDAALPSDSGKKDMNWKKALESSKFGPLAKQALQKELDSLINVNKILVPMTEEHPDFEEASRLAIKCRALLDIKRNGQVKARIVKLGFYESKEGEGFISAQVVARDSTNILLATHQEEDTLAIADITTAFLQSVKFPESVRKFVYVNNPVTGRRTYYRQTGPLYGERSAPMRWAETLSDYIINMHKTAQAKECEFNFGHFTQGYNDSCIFYNKELNLRVIIYVDDIMMSGKLSHIKKFYQLLAERFQIKEMEILSTESEIDFLGVEIRAIQQGVQLSMEAYTVKTVELFDGCIGRPAVTPYEKGALGPSPDQELNIKDRKLFMTGLGKCGWLSTCVRPDIRYAWSVIASGMARPLNEHLFRLKRLVSYLSGTAHLGVSTNHHPQMQLKPYTNVTPSGQVFSAFCDANKGGDFDGPDQGKARYGSILLINGLPISYRSTTISVAVADPELETGHVDTSSGASETYALGNFTHCLMGLKHKCTDLNVEWPSPLTVHTDNTAAQRFSQGSTPPRSKLQHIAQHQEWVIMLRNKKLFDIQYVNTKENVADMFTKPVSTAVLVHLRNKIMTKTVEDKQ
ncbi:MAG: hypothetical protein CMP26_13085, partial [Roseibacillus sp.]|nr:hypothetical protein [Roseibacillus sp.]